MKLIDADALEKAIYKWMPKYEGTWMDGWISPIENLMILLMMTIQEQPTVDAEPVRHGAWLSCDKEGYILTETALRDGRRWYGYKCSECNNIYHGNAFTKYCHNCGAKMDGERKDNETN